MVSGRRCGGDGRYLRLLYRGYELPIDRVLELGRAADCALRIAGRLVSRKHARITPAPNGAIIEDLGSRNGVVVNGQTVAGPAALQHGDRVTIGVETMLVFAAGQPPAASMTTLPPGSIPPGLSDVDGADPVTEVARVDTLSKREHQVFELIARGHTQREIASLLHISLKTVESHKAHIGKKLCCKTRAELASYARAAGLLLSPFSRLRRHQDKP